MKPPRFHTRPALLALALSAALGASRTALAQAATEDVTGVGAGGAPGAGASAQGAQAQGAPAQSTQAQSTQAQSTPQDSAIQAAVQQQAAALRQQLGITPAQEPQFNKFTQVMQANAQSLQQLNQQRLQQIGSMSALENLQSYWQIAQAQAENAGRLVAAFQPLYDALSPEQKQTADRIFRSQEPPRAQRHSRGHRG